LSARALSLTPVVGCHLESRVNCWLLAIVHSSALIAVDTVDLPFINRHVIEYALTAATATDRVVYIEYDMSGMKEADIVPTLTKDWATLVQSNVTSHSQYLHHNGLPVVGIFGFYMDRFSATTAAAILDIFQKGEPTEKAFVAGAGQWFWGACDSHPPFCPIRFVSFGLTVASSCLVVFQSGFHGCISLW
jgi:hypothetical protein